MQTFYEIPQCPICFELLTTNLMTTRCGHVFHKHCIEEALKRNDQCPLDRVVNLPEHLKSIAYSISGKSLSLTYLWQNYIPL